MSKVVTLKGLLQFIAGFSIWCICSYVFYVIMNIATASLIRKGVDEDGTWRPVVIGLVIPAILYGVFTVTLSVVMWKRNLRGVCVGMMTGLAIPVGWCLYFVKIILTE